MRLWTKRLAWVILLLALASAPAYAFSDKGAVNQVSTLDALTLGYFDGMVRISDVPKYGNLGIGTFDGLDGEMVVIDGKVYQVPVTGVVRPADPRWTTPFMAVTFFKPNLKPKVQSAGDMKALTQELEASFPSRNFFYAVRFDGTFKAVKTRSVAKQSRPYPTLIEAAKTQAVFELKDVEGTALGFWCPAYVKGINLPGYHLHFISKDRKSGGHILDFTAKNVTVKAERINGFSMVLPDTPAFGRIDFSGDRSAEVKKVE